ncbi:MAG: CPBP family intramembrane metalloprotease [Alphaproteobacteria bacterium]|nr:CPBP family intramembrane metalloprotease [Alphaproteobacteria bacterium]MBX9976862.1 CPBP family intramembrane metalloprotease [Alphaproteobacteria bacterium]
MTVFPSSLHTLLLSLTLIAVIGPWIHRKIGISTMIASVVLAFYLGYIKIAGVLALVLLGSLSYAYQTFDYPKILKGVLFFLITLVTLALFMHKMPGFANWRVLKNIQASPLSMPHALYLNLDKVFAAVLVLLTFKNAPTLTLRSWNEGLPSGIAYGAIAAAFLMLIALQSGFVALDLKVPPHALLWVLSNFAFVCIAEEVFFRGFLQPSLMKVLPGKPGTIIAIGLTSLVFAGIHYYGGPIFMGLSAIAGIVYGACYWRTGRLESAIIAHFVLNTIHYFAFSYPALLRP